MLRLRSRALASFWRSRELAVSWTNMGGVGIVDGRSGGRVVRVGRVACYTFQT